MEAGIPVNETTRRLTGFSWPAIAGVVLACGAGAQVPAPAPQLPSGVAPQAVGSTPTADQLRMLQTLPEAQRQELMRSLGISDFGAQGSTAPAAPLQAPTPLAIPLPQDDEPEGPPVLEAGSTVVVKLTLPRLSAPEIELLRRRRADSGAGTTAAAGATGADEEQRALQELARLETSQYVDPDVERLFLERVKRNPQLGTVLGSSTYVLDRQGRLNFPGVTSIALAGLTEFQASRRLEAEPRLRPLKAEVLLMPVEPFGPDSLKPFGYELFDDSTAMFAPPTDVPIPPDYMVGPGDIVRVQLYGKENSVGDFIVNRDGTINFPQLGPLAVAGMSFDDMRDEIQGRVADQMIGVSANVTMGQLRWVRVFVLGDVVRPGAYTVGGLSTVMNALFLAGGVGESGSLRRVQLRRGGQAARTLDLYELLLHGDSGRDERLQSNDIVFVPPRGPTVAVAGEVQRPAVYELAGEKSLEQVISLAGGLTATAFATSVRIERVDPSGGRSVHSVDLTGPRSGGTGVQNGDRVTIDPLPDDVLTDHVTLAGHVQRPGPFEWRPGLRLTDVIRSVNDLKPDADRG
jgi:protein involved in polysaccharide export with SLBB domain